MTRLLSLVLLGLFPLSLGAQEPGSIDGRVTGPEGEPLRAVTVSLLLPMEERLLRTQETDGGGYYRLAPLTPGRYRVRVLRLGYRPEEREVEVIAGERVRLDLTLALAPVALEGLAVEGERSRARARFEDDAGITSRELTRDEIRLLPGLAEADPLRAVEILPGVISPTDFSASFNVRGGSSDQNLILLDGFPLFNPFHLGGVFSVFNGDMVDRVELQSGGFPAEFGGRVSSVLRVESDPGPGDFTVDGGISLLAARAAVSGGLSRERRQALGLSTARWRFSARRSYVDQLLKPVATIPYHITDLQGVAEVWSRGGNRVVLSGYSGADVLDLGRLSLDDFPLRLHWEWGNRLLGARWMRSYLNGASAEAGAGVSTFRTDLAFTDFDDIRFRSDIRQLSLFARGESWMGGRWKGKAGLSADHYRYDNLAETGGTVFAGGLGDGWALAAFGQTEYRRPGRWLVETGLRFEGWLPDAGPVVWAPSPRVAAKRFFAGGDLAVKGSVGRYTQFVHSVRDEELPLGIDIWILAGDRAPHVVSDQVQVGVEGFPGDRWFAAADAFYRTFDGVITNNLADDPNDPSDDFLPGRGTGYGADFYLERRGPGPNGSLSLSWLKADRTFPDFLSGAEEVEEITYPPVFDRRVDLDLVVRLPLDGGWDIGARWHVGTGVPYTRPLASYAYFSPRQTRDGVLRWQFNPEDEPGGEPDDDQANPYGVILGPRNGERYPIYHRLDLSVRRTFTPRWGTVVPYLDVLNLYNRTNVLFYFYDFSGDRPVRTGLSMFPLLPTFGVEVRF